MVVTDGSPETYEEIFEKYNAPNYEVMNTVEQVLLTGRIPLGGRHFHVI